MSTRTKAGRALLDELAGRAIDFGTVLDHAAWAEAIAAIEREAAQQGVAEGAAQERERIRQEINDLFGLHPPPDWKVSEYGVGLPDLDAILTEPSEPKPSTITQTNEPPTRSTWDPRR